MLDRRQLAEAVEKTARLAFEGGRLTEFLRGASFKPVTKTVKEVFGDLGKTLGYQVAAAGYRCADEGEWLYDMVWFTTDAGMFIQQAMVLESEWGPGGRVQHAAEVDDDFQKLVQARADVRVWISACPNPEMTQLHIANCKHQARLFAGSVPGDAYVFIVYDWTTATIEFEQFLVDIPEKI
jgi:hypothetical protein